MVMEEEVVEDTQTWLEKMKSVEQEKRERLKRSRLKRKALEAEVADRKKRDNLDMSGIQVGHSFEALGEEPIILTLADHSVLDEHGDDVNMEEDELENINLREIEKAKKNRELLGKDFRTQYDPTDDLQQGLHREEVRQKLLAVQQLAEEEDNGPKIQSDYLTTEEMAMLKKPKEKKVKKKKKERKLRQKNAEEELIDELENGPEDKEMDVVERVVDEKQKAVKREQALEKRKKAMEQLRKEESKRRQDEGGDDVEDDDAELREALARVRRAMNQEKGKNGLLKLHENIRGLKEDNKEVMEVVDDDKIILDETSEFVRNIRNHDDDDRTKVRSKVEPSLIKKEEDVKVEEGLEGLKQEVKMENEEDEEKSGVDEEGKDEDDDLENNGAVGMAGALEHFRLIGDLNSTIEQVGRAKDKRTDMASLAAAGPKRGFDVKLQYVDDLGREMTPKEAFRRQCHIFHGKGPSRKRQEKQLLKTLAEVQLKKKGIGSDTPLEAVKALKEETAKTGQAHVVLTGPAALASALDASRASAMLSKGLGEMSAASAASEALENNGETEGKNALKRDRSEKVVFEMKSSKRQKKEMNQ